MPGHQLPRGETTPLPPVWSSGPLPHRRWSGSGSLVWRRTETRSAVLAILDAVTTGVGDLGLHDADRHGQDLLLHLLSRRHRNCLRLWRRLTAAYDEYVRRVVALG